MPINVNYATSTDKVVLPNEDGMMKEFSIVIYDSQGYSILSEKKAGNEFLINIGNLKNGNYIIEVSNSKISGRERLIINRK